MADEAKFGVTLEDRMSGPSKQAGKSIAQLGTELKKGQSQLSEYQKQLKLASDIGDIEGRKKYIGLIDQQKKSLFGLGEQLSAAKKGVDGNALSLKDAAGAANIFVQSAAAIIAVYATIVTVVGGVIAKLMEFTIETAQAKQEMLGFFDAMGGGVSTGEEVDAMLDGLQKRTGVAKDTFEGFARTLAQQGVKNLKDLEQGSLAAASAMALTGQKGADAFLELNKKIQVAVDTGAGLKIPVKGLGSLAEMGLQVSDVAKKMGVDTKTLTEQLKAGTVDAKKFGESLQEALLDKGAGPMERLANSAANLGKLIKGYIGDMFEDLGDQVAPFMAQIRDLFSIFNAKATPSGNAMKSAIGGAMTFIFQQATKVVPYIKHFFLDIVIWSLQAYIFLKKHWSTVAFILKGVGIAIGLAVGSFVLLVGIIAGAVAVVGAFVGAVFGAVSILVQFAATAVKAGADFISGLIEGILSAPGKLVDAVTSVATTAKNAFKSALGISSPSKVMMQLGAHATEGVVQGISGGAGDVGTAAAGVGQAAVGGAAGGMKGGGGGGGIQVGDVTIQITAPGGVTHALELTEAAVAALFERLMLTQGA